jgi:tRNA(His) guanylyltransferase
MSDKTSLGDRMKASYEDRYRYYLPRRTHAIIRLDGKAFHTYTRNFDKPYDATLMNAMVAGTCEVMQQIQGCVFAYQQSDEVSILITDFATIKTEAPFDYNIQKLVSVAASAMTFEFNRHMRVHGDVSDTRAGLFDARIFCIPDRIEVYNYFLWRQKDCVRNSIQSLGQAHFSHKEMHGLNTDQVQDKLFIEKNINWSEQLNEFKNGILIYPTGVIDRLPIMFSQNVDWFMNLIPIRQD